MIEQSRIAEVGGQDHLGARFSRLKTNSHGVSEVNREDYGFKNVISTDRENISRIVEGGYPATTLLL